MKIPKYERKMNKGNFALFVLRRRMSACSKYRIIPTSLVTIRIHSALIGLKNMRSSFLVFQNAYYSLPHC